MFGQKHNSRQHQLYPPRPGYLSVLINNWSLRDRHRKLGILVDKLIKQEEVAEQRKPKFGYGSSFRLDRRTPEIPSRTRSLTPSTQRRQKPELKSRHSFSGRINTPDIYSSSRHQSVRTQKFEQYKRISTPSEGWSTQCCHNKGSGTYLDTSDNEIKLDDIYEANLVNDRIEPLWFPDSEFRSESPINMLSPNPPLPGGGLERSKTSIAVYSNLASHNRHNDEIRRPKMEVLPVVKSGDQFKLLQAVKKSDVVKVNAIFEDNPNMNLRYIDDMKSVNIEILKLLLNRMSPVNDYGKTTVPVLHMATRLGHTYCVYLLLKHGADVNIQHTGTYRTALHEAVLGGHRQIVELLLFNNADETLREREGRVASDLCRENTFPRKVYSSIQETVTDNRIDIQEVNSQTTARLTNTRASVRLKEEVQNENVPFIVKRHTFEARNADINLDDQDDIISDIYTCQSVCLDFNGHLTISLPLFEKSCSSRETVVVMTSSGQEIQKCETETDKENLVVTFDALVTDKDTFVALSRPTIEQWQVGKTSAVLESVIDDGVKININKSTFNKNALVLLQIIELTEDIEIQEGQILASTPFYKVSTEVPPLSGITVELPKPGHLGEEGEMTILVKVGDSWTNVKNQSDDKHQTVSFEQTKFPIIACVVRAKTGSSFDTMVTETRDTLTQVLNTTYNVCFLCYTNRISNTRSFNVVVECCRSKYVELRRRYWKGQGYLEQTGKYSGFNIDTPSNKGFKLVFYESAITRKNPRIIDLEFHRKRHNIVMFLVELKGKSIQFINGRLFLYNDSAPSGNKFDLSNQPQHLIYIDVNLLLNQTGTTYLGVDGSTTSSSTNLSADSRGTGSQDSYRSTSPKPGATSSQTSARPKSRAANSQLNVRPKSHAAKSAKDSRITPTENNQHDFETDSLKKLQSSLAKAMKNVDPVVAETIPVVVTPDDEDDGVHHEQQQQPFHENGTDFLDDKMMEMIIEELGDDWYKVFVLMGINFVDIEDEISLSRNTYACQRKLFSKWKELNMQREDCGIPLLLGALFKGGCRNVGSMVQIQLKQWFEKWKDNGEAFTQWVTKAYQNSDLLVPSDYPKPMTDAYLVLMSDELPPSKELAQCLLIGDSEAEDIVQSPAYLLDGIRVMKIFTLFRDRTQRGIDALKTLISCLDDMGYIKMKNYSVMCAKAWVKRTATRRDDPFRYQVDQLMNKFD